MSVNKWIGIGHVGVDPEIKVLESGRTVGRFTLATNETFKTQSGEKRTNTEWHNIIVWEKLAEIAEKYVRKGNLLYIEGKITTRSWDDKDGKKRYQTEIICNTLKMLGGNVVKSDDKDAQEKENKSSEPEDLNPDNPDDLPF